MVLYTYSRKVLYMESREERYSNNLSRQSKNKDLYNQVYGLEDNLDNLPLSKNEIYITKMQTEINTRDEYRKSRGDKTLSETTPQVKEESIPIQEVEKNVYDINKVLDKVKADNEKKSQPEQPTPKEDYLKKLNIDNIDEVKEMYDDIISSVDEETENRLQKTANLSLEILSDLKGDNEEQDVGIKLALRAMEAPLRQIVTNAGEEASVVASAVKNGEGNFGYNAGTEQYGDMIEMGILDPTKVTRSALQFAASVAGLMITTECMVTDLPKDDKADLGAAGMGGMGGMGGMM